MYSNVHVCLHEHTVMLMHVHCIAHSCTTHLDVSFTSPTKQYIITITPKFHYVINRIPLLQCISLSIPAPTYRISRGQCSSFHTKYM